jgi:flavodoxin
MGLFGKKESYKNKKSLVIYYSRADENYAVGYVEKGNTEYIAEFVADITHADLFKVEPLVPYSKEYNTCIKEAKERIGNAPIKETIKDISQYEVIYIMSPIYWGTYAPEMETALKDLDFTGKVVRVVTTHERKWSC